MRNMEKQDSAYKRALRVILPVAVGVTAMAADKYAPQISELGREPQGHTQAPPDFLLKQVKDRAKREQSPVVTRFAGRPVAMNGLAFEGAKVRSSVASSSRSETKVPLAAGLLPIGVLGELVNTPKKRRNAVLLGTSMFLLACMGLEVGAPIIAGSVTPAPEASAAPFVLNPESAIARIQEFGAKLPNGSLTNVACNAPSGSVESIALQNQQTKQGLEAVLCAVDVNATGVESIKGAPALVMDSGKVFLAGHFSIDISGTHAMGPLYEVTSDGKIIQNAANAVEVEINKDGQITAFDWMKLDNAQYDVQNISVATAIPQLYAFSLPGIMNLDAVINAALINPSNPAESPSPTPTEIVQPQVAIPEYMLGMTQWTDANGNQFAGKEYKTPTQDIQNPIIAFNKETNMWWPLGWTTWQDNGVWHAGVVNADQSKVSMVSQDAATHLWLPDTFTTDLATKKMTLKANPDNKSYGVDGVSGLTINADGTASLNLDFSAGYYQAPDGLYYKTGAVADGKGVSKDTLISTNVFPSADLSFSKDGNLRLAGYEWNGKEWKLVLPSEFPKTTEEMPQFTSIDLATGSLMSWRSRVFTQTNEAAQFEGATVTNEWKADQNTFSAPGSLDSNRDGKPDTLDYRYAVQVNSTFTSRNQEPFRTSKSFVNLRDLPNIFAGFVTLKNADSTFADYPVGFDKFLLDEKAEANFNSTLKYLSGYPVTGNYKGTLFEKMFIMPVSSFGPSATMDSFGGTATVTLLRSDTQRGVDNEKIQNQMISSGGIFYPEAVGRTLWGAVIINTD